MDRRGSRFTAEVMAQLLGISGNITHVEFNHKTNTVDVIFNGNGSFQCAEGMEVCIRTPSVWRQWDAEQEEKETQKLEEELEAQWELD